MVYRPNDKEQGLYELGGLKIVEEGQPPEKIGEPLLRPHSEIYSDLLIMFGHFTPLEIINYFKTTPAEEFSNFDYAAAQQVLLEKIVKILKEKTGTKSNRLEKKFEPQMDL